MIKRTWENYKKPVPIKWRKIGDFVLVVGTFLNGSIMSLPIPEHTKLWSMFIIGFLTTCLKFWANTKKDEDTVLVDNPAIPD